MIVVIPDGVNRFEVEFKVNGGVNIRHNDDFITLDEREAVKLVELFRELTKGCDNCDK